MPMISVVGDGPAVDVGGEDGVDDVAAARLRRAGVATNSPIHARASRPRPRGRPGWWGWTPRVACSLSSLELVGRRVQHQVEEGEARERRGEVGHEVARARAR